ncbi:MAG TPA: hypothetical protein VL981_07415 [Candidatus Methylacidiphilales bacterium]|nr:hypothetical protein [Candidatus Methylacidiphilales bacterium]
MTRNEAKFVLQSMRPDGSDADDPVFAEALELVQTDSELKAWWEAQQSFDREIAAKLEEIAAPLSLRDTIISQRNKVIALPQRSYLGPWFAAAAALVLIAVILNLFLVNPSSGSPVFSEVYVTSALGALNDDKPALGMTSPDHGRVMAWLKERHAPTGTLPSHLAALPSVGCQTFEVYGHTVSLICFTLVNGKLAHLFIMNQGALIDPPGSSPEYAEKYGWSTAIWSRDGKSYILATRAGPEILHALL